MTTFSREADFEVAVIDELTKRGWEPEIIKNPSEKDLIANWAEILFENNKGIDQLNDTPLTDGEMQQIMEQITELRSPLKLNGFINGKSIAIKRDNEADALHYGKEVSLKIFDRHEIAAGQSRYQIVQQPKFARKSSIMHDRRGDLMLLINGMPVIHIELKKSGVPVSNGYNQILKYSREGIFTGLFSLVQLFVAMEPNESLYFANAGPDGTFNRDYAFHWADYNNEPQNEWSKVISGLLAIPMAHQLIGFYTVADESDGVLKVMRSYQYFAARAISNRVAETKWDTPNSLGGYIWHTTGSGKTMTSFKSAQLIANSNDADKVVFLLDRIELGTQTLEAYRNFAGDGNTVQATEDTKVLTNKLTSSNYTDTLIVSSIQKMSNLHDQDGGMRTSDLEKIRAKRIVFIIDECHRSTFGDMLETIKRTFSGAVFFGFSGTPIQKENMRKDNTTTDVFGNELHRYSIADGIRDKNVLGFYPYKLLTHKDRELRKVIALEKAKADSEADAFADAKKKEIYNKYMNDLPMAGHRDELGHYVKGIEDHIPNSQYNTDGHNNAVVKDISDNWQTLSQGNKFHAIFATHSIPEAINYYRLLKEHFPTLKTTALFDPHISDEDGGGDPTFKENGLIKIMEDYNEQYSQKFDLGSHANFKKDIANRLAHKAPYTRITVDLDKQLDLLIVVDQMLTGFDSKWVNTLYMDKMLKYENIIQAFSRTNRLFGADKPFGTIRYYRKPHTMERDIKAAVKLYSGDREIGLFVNRLPSNLTLMNQSFERINSIFDSEKIEDFKKLPDDLAVRATLVKEINQFNRILEAVKIQGFTWDQSVYDFEDDKDQEPIEVDITRGQFLTLVQRVKELSSTKESSNDNHPYDIESHITEIDTGKIDADYMNSRFKKYLRDLKNSDPESKSATLAELQRSFASLPQEEQRLAERLLLDIQRGEIQINEERTFRDYLTDYQAQASNKQIEAIVDALGIDPALLTPLLETDITEANINEYSRFDHLKDTIDKTKATAYFESLTGESIPPFKVNIKAATALRNFIINGVFDL